MLKPVEVPEGLDKRLLGCVFGGRGVTQHQVRGPERRLLMQEDKGLVGRCVAAYYRGDQLLLVQPLSLRSDNPAL